MFVTRNYKEGLITNKKGNIIARMQFKASIQDLTIYETMKEFALILADTDIHYRINLVSDDILDEAPASEKPSQQETGQEDIKITVPKGEYIVNNIVLTDEDIYGQTLDGENRRYRLIYVNGEGEETYVPLEGFDTFTAENPHGQFSYNSETKQLIFSAMYHTDTEYILRRYF